jgi:hypothetical protein
MESASDFGDRPSAPLCGLEQEGPPAQCADAGKRTENGLVGPARGLVRFLYSSNPFYILSADLVFVGLRASFGSGGQASRTGVLLLGLGAYTLLPGLPIFFQPSWQLGIPRLSRSRPWDTVSWHAIVTTWPVRLSAWRPGWAGQAGRLMHSSERPPPAWIRSSGGSSSSRSP